MAALYNNNRSFLYMGGQSQPACLSSQCLSQVNQGIISACLHMKPWFIMIGKSVLNSVFRLKWKCCCQAFKGQSPQTRQRTHTLKLTCMHLHRHRLIHTCTQTEKHYCRHNNRHTCRCMWNHTYCKHTQTRLHTIALAHTQHAHTYTVLN